MSRFLRALILPACAVLLLVVAGAPGLAAQGFETRPAVALKGVPFSLVVNGPAELGDAVSFRIVDATGAEVASGSVDPLGSATVEGVVIDDAEALPLTLEIAGVRESLDPTLVNGWFSLLPPLLAIALALVFREVVTALVAGVWLGALAVAGFNPLQATWRMIDGFILPAVADASHASIIIFSMLLGGMVGLVSRNGGTMGIVEALAPVASTRRRGKIATWIAGLAIFFDDYANTLIVGNTMRPITDRLKISREKLAYLVDSTAAPVAAMVPISTWVGYEISLIADGIAIAEAQHPAGGPIMADLASTSPFLIFIHTIPYLFYPILALFFVFLTSAMNRDWGPMAAAERRASTGGGLYRPGAQLAMDTESARLEPKEGAPRRWWNAALPVFTVIVVVLGGLYTTGVTEVGAEATLMDIFGAADPFVTLLWGSLAGCLMAFGLSLAQRILTLDEAISAWLDGIRGMMIAMIILTLAWSLGAVTEQVGTAAYLAGLLEGTVPLQLMPWLVFVTAAVMAFATGTSWGTMAILIPLVIPLAVTMGGATDFGGGGHYSIVLGVISSVLAGAVFGDHCSPISDTTVLSSTAAGCDHVDHVHTQLPYAVLVATVSMVLGDLGTAYGLPNTVALGGGAVILWAFLRFRGERIPEVGETTIAEADRAALREAAS